MKEVSTNVEKALVELGFENEAQEVAKAPETKEVIKTEISKTEISKTEASKEASEKTEWIDEYKKLHGIKKDDSVKVEPAKVAEPKEVKTTPAKTDSSSDSIEELKAELAKVKAEFEALKKKY
jgi:hypothetical protein